MIAGHQTAVWETKYVPAASYTLESLLAVGCTPAMNLLRTGEKTVGFVLLRSSPKVGGIKLESRIHPRRH